VSGRDIPQCETTLKTLRVEEGKEGEGSTLGFDSRRALASVFICKTQTHFERDIVQKGEGKVRIPSCGRCGRAHFPPSAKIHAHL
jgi:hypothetical protein